MFFHSSKNNQKKNPQISVYQDNRLLYQGNWMEIPLREDVIIENSIRFFDDPAPCFIHQNAVRVRLLSQLELDYKSISSSDDMKKWLKNLTYITGLPTISHVSF